MSYKKLFYTFLQERERERIHKDLKIRPHSKNKVLIQFLVTPAAEKLTDVSAESGHMNHL